MPANFNQATINFFKKMNRLGKRREPFFFMIDFDLKKPVLIPLKNLDEQSIQVQTPIFETSEMKASNEKKSEAHDTDFYFEKEPISFKNYKKKFDAMLAELNFGNSYLINLTQPTPIKTNLSLQEIFTRSTAKFKLLFKDKFVVFSPERFVEIKENQILTYPMKGTIDATLPNAREQLMSNKKEIAEHNTIVDLLRNDLNMVSKKVRVNKFRFIDKIETSTGSLLQASSEIVGDLASNWNEYIGDVFEKILPAGSVTGAPKRKTVEIIKTVEGYERGYYTGIFGIFDGRSLDSAVMIRFIEKQGEKMVFKSGGGITAKSNVREEYDELIQKVYVPITRNNKGGKRQNAAPRLAPTTHES